MRSSLRMDIRMRTKKTAYQHFDLSESRIHGVKCVVYHTVGRVLLTLGDIASEMEEQDSQDDRT